VNNRHKESKTILWNWSLAFSCLGDVTGFEITLHDFRKELVSSQLKANTDLLTISRSLGRENLSPLETYAKQNKTDLINKYVSPMDDND
jgi:hypothetical protein